MELDYEMITENEFDAMSVLSSHHDVGNHPS